MCKHTPGKNLFGCDTHGTMVLKEINGVAPTTGSGREHRDQRQLPGHLPAHRVRGDALRPEHDDHIPGSEAGAPVV